MLNKLSTRTLLAIIAILILVGGSLVVTAVYNFIPDTPSVSRVDGSPTSKETTPAVMQTSTPLRSLTSTATAAPSSTATAISTRTSTATQLPPTSIPATKVHAFAPISSSLPLLTADLYFLRARRLWYWPAQKDKIEAMAVDSTAPIQAYQLTADGQKLVYLTASGKLYFMKLSDATPQLTFTPEGKEHILGFEVSPDGRYVAQETNALAKGPPHLYLLDQITQERLSLGWSAGEFAFTADGRYLLYSSSNDEAGAYPGQQANLFLLDLQANHEITELTQFGCRSLALAPDGTQAAYAESYRDENHNENERLWLIHIPSGAVQLLRSGSYPTFNDDLSWSRDSRWFVNKVCSEGCGLVLFDADTAQEVSVPKTSCFVGCELAYGWGPKQLWVVSLGRAPDGLSDSTLEYSLIAGLSGEKLDVQYQLTDKLLQPWCPRTLFFVPDKWLLFTHVDCRQKATSPYALQEGGVYLQRIGGQPEDLMALSLTFGEFLSGSPIISWSLEGDTFLYMAEMVSNSGQENRLIPLLLGLTDGSALWNVQEVLAGASSFQWGQSVK